MKLEKQYIGTFKGKYINGIALNIRVDFNKVKKIGKNLFYVGMTSNNAIVYWQVN